MFPSNSSRHIFSRILLTAGLLSPAAMLAATPSPVVVTLTVTPSTAVNAADVVSLTAQVSESGSPFTFGRVLFCETSAPHCDDQSSIGESEIVNYGSGSGEAIFRTRLAPGAHAIKAVFAGLPANGIPPTASAPQSITVIGKQRTATSISVSLDTKVYTGTVDVFGTTPITGTVDFVDAADPAHPIAAAQLNQALPSFQALSLQNVIPGSSHQNPPVVAVADFNNDGILDIASAVTSSASVQVNFGKGDGTFVAGPVTKLNAFASSLKVAYLKGDGNPDLVFISAGEVAVLLGNGDGTFRVGETLAQDPGAYYSAAAGDFNGDGSTDIVIAGGADVLAVYYGQNDGTFSKAVILPLPSGLTSIYNVQAADFNGDGYSDVIGDSYPDSFVNGELSVVVYLSKGSSKAFTAIQTTTQPRLVTPPVVADFNGDGIPDLAFYRHDHEPLATQLFVKLGKGDGSFAPDTMTDFSSLSLYGVIAPHLSGLTVTDFNHDGITDFISIGSGDYGNPGADTLVQAPLYLQGKGDGTFFPIFGPAVTNTGSLYGPPYPAIPLDQVIDLAQGVTGDFNADGNLDFINVNQNAPQALLSTRESQAIARNVALLSQGQHHVFAFKGGDASHLTSASGTTLVYGFPFATTTTLTIIPGQCTGCYALQSDVEPYKVGQYYAAGTVDLYDGSTVIARTGPGPQGLISGPFSSGTHNFKLVFTSSNIYFSSSESPVYTITVP